MPATSAGMTGVSSMPLVPASDRGAGKPLGQTTDTTNAPDKRLAIIVPYRDRRGHLDEFLPHIAAYFERDELTRDIAVSVHVIEQLGRAPFNRGKIKNCGYMLARNAADYVCFHDVDYLPISADYSWSDRPARLCWHGLVLREDYESFFGAVILMPNACFEMLNGYPNCYWGWGREDFELRQRTRMCDIEIERRDGTFRSLPHQHAGYAAPGVLTEEARKTVELFLTRRDYLRAFMPIDGLKSLEFAVVDRRPLPMSSRFSASYHYTVDIGAPPDNAL